jgi:hypothetical protein
VASIAYYIVKIVVSAFNMGDSGVAEAVSAVVIMTGFFFAAVRVNANQYPSGQKGTGVHPAHEAPRGKR